MGEIGDFRCFKKNGLGGDVGFMGNKLKNELGTMIEGEDSLL